MKILSNNKPLHNQPAFKAKFDLKVIQGSLDISPEKMDEFVNFFKGVGSDNDTVEALVRHMPSTKEGHKKISIDFISSIAGASKFSNTSVDYPVNHPKLNLGSAILRLCKNEFINKTEAYKKLKDKLGRDPRLNN